MKKNDSQPLDETDRIASSGVGALLDRESDVMLELEGDKLPVPTGNAEPVLFPDSSDFIERE
jgi:hypothetical protein